MLRYLIAKASMPNSFAYLMLFVWPLVALVLFRTLPLSKALIWTILGGYLFLPSATGIKIPMIPTIDKISVPTVSAAFFCLIYEWRETLLSRRGAERVRPPKPRGRVLIVGLLVVLFVTPILSVLNNAEPIIVGVRFIAGLRIYDAFSMISSTLVAVLPFLLGWRYLSGPEAHRHLITAFAVAGLIYSLPVLFEVRMSPQLHTWIYGFFPHDFIQHIREGGFRPVVFLSHGLLVGVLMCIAILASLTLWREALREGRAGRRWLLAAAWLMGVLLLSKNLGATAITVFVGTIVLLGGRRLQAIVAAFVAVVVLLYPMLRGAGVVPVDAVYEFAQSISDERARSLKFRLDNEDALLAHANEKPLSGWGSWGRNQLFDPETGRMVSVTDGMWVILIGIYGWLGYVAHFGLLTLPLLFYAYRRKQFSASLITPGLGLILSAILIDLLPNAGLVPYVWLVAGALTGFGLRESAESVQAEMERAGPPLSRAHRGRRQVARSAGAAAWAHRRG